jgi:hypothetical protein
MELDNVTRVLLARDEKGKKNWGMLAMYCFLVFMVYVYCFALVLLLIFCGMILIIDGTVLLYVFGN